MKRISDIIRELEEIKSKYGDLHVMHEDDEGYTEELTYGIVCDVRSADIGRMVDREEYDIEINTDLTDSKEDQIIRKNRFDYFDREKNEEGKMRVYVGEDKETVVILQ